MTWRLGPFGLLTEHHNPHVCVSYKLQKCVSHGSEGRTSLSQEPGARARARAGSELLIMFCRMGKATKLQRALYNEGH